MTEKTGTRRNRRNRKQAVIMLAAITTAVWLVFVIGKIIITSYIGEKFHIMDVVNSIFDNILGILPPIIIFNFAFEYLTQDYVSDEISEQITSTLMSDPDTIQLFEDHVKCDFLKATISAMAKQETDESNVAMQAIQPYLESRFNFRKNFQYFIDVSDYPDDEIFKSDAYLRVSEELHYIKQLAASVSFEQTFKIGMFIENEMLDRHLRKNEYLMREALNIHPCEMKKLLQLAPDMQKKYILNTLKVRAYVNNISCDVTDARITANGIEVSFHSSHITNEKEYKIDITFCMPQSKEHTSFWVSIPEPTYSPTIRFSFPQNMQATMFPFFNDLEDAVVEQAQRGLGSCNISISEKWIYPVSGAVFFLHM